MDHSGMNEKIGKTIAGRLKDLGKGQAWLAERAGVSVNAVSKWTKTGKIARENVPVVAEALGLSAGDLISGGGEVISPRKTTDSKLERLDPKEQALLAMYRECGEGEQDILLTHAKLLAGSRATVHESFRRNKT